MKYIKLWEAFREEKIFYKLIDESNLDSILSDGLLPGKDGGVWVIAEDNFDDWLKPNNLFGSMLQALCYFPAKRKIRGSLLKIKIKPNNIKVRNVDLMLKDMKGWKSSIQDINDLSDVDFNINEYLIMDRIDPSKIEVVNSFDMPLDLVNYIMDPITIKDYIFGISKNIKKLKRISTFSLLLKFISLKLREKFF